MIVTLTAITFQMILGKNTKIPPTTITNLSHAQATRQNIIAGRHSGIYTWLWVDKKA